MHPKEPKSFFFFLLISKSPLAGCPEKFWWVFRSVDMPECLVLEVHIIYQNTKSQFRVNCSQSNDFDVEAGLHQGSLLNPLFSSPFLLEAFSREFRTGCVWDFLDADDIVIPIKIMDESLLKMDLWRKTPRFQRNLSELGKD